MQFQEAYVIYAVDVDARETHFDPKDSTILVQLQVKELEMIKELVIEKVAGACNEIEAVAKLVDFHRDIKYCEAQVNMMKDSARLKAKDRLDEIIADNEKRAKK